MMTLYEFLMEMINNNNRKEVDIEFVCDKNYWEENEPKWNCSWSVFSGLAKSLECEQYNRFPAQGFMIVGKDFWIDHYYDGGFVFREKPKVNGATLNEDELCDEILDSFTGKVDGYFFHYGENVKKIIDNFIKTGESMDVPYEMEIWNKAEQYGRGIFGYF